MTRITTLLFTFLTFSGPATAYDLGERNAPAPPLEVAEWVHLPEGAEPPTIESLRGKVVYLYTFKANCPGCHKRGFPTLQDLVERYGEREDVAFVAVLTAFDGSPRNTPVAARSTVVERYELDIPVGYDPTHPSGEGAGPLMRSYRTRGTPWTILIDRQGRVRFDDFSLETERAAAAIDFLLSEPSAER